MSVRSFEESSRIVTAAVMACDSIGSASEHVDDVLTASFAELRFDSLAFMEFCIAIQSETGVELSVGVVSEMGSPEAVARYLCERA